MNYWSVKIVETRHALSLLETDDFGFLPPSQATVYT